VRGDRLVRWLGVLALVVPPARRGRVRWLGVCALVGVLAGCSPGSQPAPPTTSSSAPAGLGELFVDPTSAAAHQEADWRAAGRTADADQIAKIASRAQARWLPSDPARVEGEARALVTRAAGRTPVVVGYALPHRDCAGGYSAGGAADAAGYRSWVDALARGLGHAGAVVVLEPDAIPDALTCLSGADRTERYALLAEAVGALTDRAGAHVYLDAGNPGWIRDTDALAAALRSSGVARASGFALNVANFYPTDAVVDYGRDLSAKLGGAHFVVDTGRNGNGPNTDDTSGAPRWCNPPGRALGHPPTTRTGLSDVDAFLWVKNPGESDGDCRPGEPKAGQWYPEYALALATATP
jgi:endoglucanase